MQALVLDTLPSLGMKSASALRCSTIIPQPVSMYGLGARIEASGRLPTPFISPVYLRCACSLTLHESGNSDSTSCIYVLTVLTVPAHRMVLWSGLIYA
eukprot:1188938-Pyramimonas_sp.AAC.2